MGLANISLKPKKELICLAGGLPLRGGCYSSLRLNFLAYPFRSRKRITKTAFREDSKSGFNSSKYGGIFEEINVDSITNAITNDFKHLLRDYMVMI